MSFFIGNHRRRDARGRKGIAGMGIIALLSAFALTGCAGDRLKAPTKCDAVSAVIVGNSIRLASEVESGDALG